MKNYFLYIAIVFLILASCKEQASEKVQIAAAANMQFPIKELMAAFEEETGIACNVSISSSGNLTNQIKNGAPYDIFLSADMSYPDDLYKNGFAPEPAKAYAFGKLVLWTSTDEIPTIELLTEDRIKHIAIGNPRLAPYGVAAQEVLQHYGLFETLREKYVFGESITQVNQFIDSGAAEVGFTALAVVKSPNNSGNGNWTELPEALYSPIGQGAVLIKQKGEISEKSQLFYNFLFSQKAKDILRNYGYSFN